MDVKNDINYKVALYMRLSKDDGDKEESESITNQRKILRTYAKENGYVIYDEYIDDGYSGTNFNRPGFKKLIKDIEAKRVNMVITKNLARLGRDYIETGRYIETFFPENQIRYIAVLDDVDTFLDKNCDTVAFKNIMNDYYAKETSKNIKKTKNRKKREGFYYVSYAPFGYDKIDKSGRLKINNNQAEIVRRIYKEFLNGKGTYQIAKMLTQEQVTTPGIQMNMTRVVNNITKTTNMWTHTGIKRILTNPIYIGTIVQNKSKKISYKSKKRIKLPEQEYTIIKNHHEAIINIEIWNSVQKKLENNKGEKIKEEDPLLKSLLYCSHCHNRLSLIVKKEKYKDKITIRKYIVCGTAQRKVSNKTCYKQYINYNKLEPLILDKIANIFEKYLNSNEFNNKEALKKIIDSQENKSKFIQNYENIQKELECINKKISTLYSDKLNGLIEAQDYAIFSEGLLKERHRLEEIKLQTEKEINEFDSKSNDNIIEDKMKKILNNIVKNKNFTRDILQQIVNKIEIDKDKNILIHFNFFELNCLGGYFNAKQATNK